MQAQMLVESPVPLPLAFPLSPPLRTPSPVYHHLDEVPVFVPNTPPNFENEMDFEVAENGLHLGKWIGIFIHMCNTICRCNFHASIFFFFLFRFLTDDYSESGNYRDSVENQSPSTNESFDLLYTEDMEELPDVDSLARYIYSTMSDSEMAFVTEFGRMLEQNFGEI